MEIGGTVGATVRRNVLVDEVLDLCPAPARLRPLAR
jgi:hypothetical protein